MVARTMKTIPMLWFICLAGGVSGRLAWIGLDGGAVIENLALLLSIGIGLVGIFKPRTTIRLPD